MVAVAASSPVDIATIVTNLGIFSLAVTAAVAGIFTGWQKVKKSLGNPATPPPGGQDFRVLSASIMETTSMRELTEQNRRTADALERVCKRLEEAVEALSEHRSSMRSAHEEVHRLGVAIRDANQILMGLRR